MANFHNPSYSGGIPVATGDRYYAQDLFRDYLSVIDEANRSLALSYRKDFRSDLPMSVLIYTDGFKQGVGNTLNIGHTVGVVTEEFTFPDSFAALPPTTVQQGVALKIDFKEVFNAVVTGATLNGTTRNYVFVGVELNPLSTKNRTRAKAAGGYDYEAEWRMYWRNSTGSAAGRNEILLGNFRGTSGGVWNVESIRGEGGGVVTVVDQSPHRMEEMWLPADAVVGTRINIFVAPNQSRLRIRLRTGELLARDLTSRAIGFGWFDARPGQRIELTRVDTLGLYREVPIKIADPADLPSGNAQGMAWSPDGRYLVLGLYTPPYIIVYDWITGVPVKVPDPAIPPAGRGYNVAWSPDGRLFAIAHDTFPFVSIYGITSLGPVKTANPTVPPAGNGRGVAWSHDGKYLAVGHHNWPFVTIYSWHPGFPNKIPDPLVLPTGAIWGLGWSPNGRYLAVAGDPAITIYDFLTAYYAPQTTAVPKAPDPDSFPVGSGRVAIFSPDGKYLAVGYSNSPFLFLYDYTSDVARRLPSPPPPLLLGTCIGGAWSPDSRHLILGASAGGTPWIVIYDWVRGRANRRPDPPYTPPGSTFGMAWSPDGRYAAMSHAGHPYIAIYDFLSYSANGWVMRVTDGPQPDVADFENITPF